MKARRGIGHGTSSLLKCIEQLRLLRSNTPKEEEEGGWQRRVWVFDHISCHTAMADDANAN